MKIVLTGKPIAKMRHRYSVRAGHVISYDPQKEEKEAVKVRFIEAIQKVLNGENKKNAQEAASFAFCEAFEVELYFHLPISEKATPRSNNAKLWGIQLPNTKPDYDNLEKFYLDCANGILWPDDRMIVTAHAYKFYSENPRLEVNIMKKTGLNLTKTAEDIILNFSPSELRNFINDFKSIASLNPDCFDESFIQIHPENIELIAELIREFSIKHGSIIKKIHASEERRKSEKRCTTGEVKER